MPLPRRSPSAAQPVDASIPLYQQVRYRGLLTVAVMGASVMQILDTTIANVAIPHMRAPGATSETVNWVLTSYIIARQWRCRSTAGSPIGSAAAIVPCGDRRLRPDLDGVRRRAELEEMVAFRFPW